MAAPLGLAAAKIAGAGEVWARAQVGVRFNTLTITVRGQKPRTWPGVVSVVRDTPRTWVVTLGTGEKFTVQRAAGGG